MSDFIKAIFQEIASGSQVIAQLAPERQANAFFLPPCYLGRKERKGKKKGKEKITLWSGWMLVELGRSAKEIGQKRKVGDCALGAGFPVEQAALGKSGAGWEAESELLNERLESRIGAQVFSAPGQQSHCLRSVSGGQSGRRVWRLTPALGTQWPRALLGNSAFIRVRNRTPERELYFQKKKKKRN